MILKLNKGYYSSVFKLFIGSLFNTNTSLLSCISIKEKNRQSFYFQTHPPVISIIPLRLFSSFFPIAHESSRHNFFLLYRRQPSQARINTDNSK